MRLEIIKNVSSPYIDLYIQYNSNKNPTYFFRVWQVDSTMYMEEL